MRAPILTLFVLLSLAPRPAAGAEAVASDLALGRDLLDRGAITQALSLLSSSLNRATEDGDGAGCAHLLVEVGRARALLGENRTALWAVRKAVCSARDTGDPALLHRIALHAERVARRAGDGEQALTYLTIARDAARSIRYQPVHPERLATGEIPEGLVPRSRGTGWPGQGFLDTAPFDPVRDKARDRAPEDPMARFSQQGSQGAFRARVRSDPEYLPQMIRMKSWREPHHHPDSPILACPRIPPPELRFFSDDAKLVGEAYQYYKFVLKLRDTVDDPFALATLWINYSFLNRIHHPAMDVMYLVTKGAAMAEAIRRIIAFSPYVGTMELAIFALDKTVIDVIRKVEKRRPEAPFDPGP